MGTTQDFTRSFLPSVHEETAHSNSDPEKAGVIETDMYDDVPTTLSLSHEGAHRSAPSALHCDCSAPPRNKGVGEEEPATGFPKPGGVRLQIQAMEKYALEKIPSPVRIKPEGKAHDIPPLDLSPPPSPKRKRESDHKEDMKNVAFTAVLPAKNVDLHRSQSTF